MGTNIFSAQRPSENGLSDFERGLSTDGFQSGNGGNTAVPVRAPKREIFPKPLPANTDFYPGHDGYLYIVQELLKSIKSDTILLPAGSVTDTSTEATDIRISAATVAASGFQRTKHNDTPIWYCSLTVDNLVKSLVDRFCYDFRSPTGKSNWEWCDPDANILPDELETKLKEALLSPQGFPSRLDPRVNPLGFLDDSWDTWGGTHWGIWLADFETRDYMDTAVWEWTTQVKSEDPADLPDSTTGTTREYDHQHVTWLERKTYDAVEEVRGGKDIINHSEHGWNSSHPDVSYLWGWDPKDWKDPVSIKYPGTWGVHVGFPFLLEEGKDKIHFILWLTPTEVFLETINLSKKDTITIKPTMMYQLHSDPKWTSSTIPTMVDTPKEGHPKSSTSLNGRGQWVVEKSY